MAREYEETLYAPRIITPDNTPIYTEATNIVGNLCSHVIQDNQDCNREDYELCVDTAVGKIAEKERKIDEIRIKESSAYKTGHSDQKYYEDIRYVHDHKIKFDELIGVKYINGILYINGNAKLCEGKCSEFDTALTTQESIDEKLERIDDWKVSGYRYRDFPLVIDRNTFSRYLIYYKMKDGRTTKNVNGLIEREDITLAEFWNEIVDGTKTIVINGNIDIDKDSFKICDGDRYKGIYESTDLSKVKIIKNGETYQQSEFTRKNTGAR